jgi:hypothetical protein
LEIRRLLRTACSLPLKLWLIFYIANAPIGNYEYENIIEYYLWHTVVRALLGPLLPKRSGQIEESVAVGGQIVTPSMPFRPDRK